MQVQIYLTTNSLSRDIGMFTGMEGHKFHLLFYLQVFLDLCANIKSFKIVLWLLLYNRAAPALFILAKFPGLQEEDFSLSKSAV